jgi:ATP-dependent Clp protease protease subunit
MTGARSILRASALGALLAVLLLALTGLAGLAVFAVAAFRDPEWARDVGEAWFQEAADSLTEAGFEAGGVDPDDPLLEERILVITESINERVARRVIESLLYLDRLDGESPITLYIATTGGWVDPAFAIVDAIDSIRAPVDTIAIGGCFSAGSIILAAGTGTRSATPNAILSIHANSAEGEAALSYERISRERFTRHFEQHAALPREWFPLIGDKSYYLTPEEAVKHRLIDRVASPVRSPLSPGAASAAPQAGGARPRRAPRARGAAPPAGGRPRA